MDMGPTYGANNRDLQTVVDSVYCADQQQLRTKIFLETATHDEIIANYKNHDPLGEIYQHELTESEVRALLEHQENIAFANYLGGLTLLHDTSPTESALRDTENTQKAIAAITRNLVTVEYVVEDTIDHRIIDLHNAYAGTANRHNIHLLQPGENEKRLIGAQSLRSGIHDMHSLASWREVTPMETVSFNLALQAAGGIVFGSMLRLLADKFNHDGSINRENLSQLLESVKLYVAPTLSQTDEVYSQDQRRDFGIACIVLGEALKECGTPDLKNALVKGSLHELLWQLDAFALTKGRPEKYGKLCIISADYAEDRGNIQNLALRRGHDFRVFNQKTQKATYVQLKSHTSQRNDKPYADQIEIHREQDFHKLVQNPTLITDKLELYYGWSQTNFDTTLFESHGLESVILPTVKEVFDGLSD